MLSNEKIFFTVKAEQSDFDDQINLHEFSYRTQIQILRG